MILFNKPAYVGNEDEVVCASIRDNKLSGDGKYSRLCQSWLEENFKCKKALLTPSCTAALEMAALLIDIQPGDEVIMPSYTFVSTANAFVLRGAKIVFVDISPDTMNLDVQRLNDAITEKTRAIVPVHYAGIACDMDVIMDISRHHDLIVIEDAAQAVMASYKDKPLGTVGHLGCYSFHETKNYTSGGEGGALIINDDRFIKRAEIIREKGTNRSQFLRGQIDKYTWRDIGSSYLPSEIQAAYLYAQLQSGGLINQRRLSIWNKYHQGLKDLDDRGVLNRPMVPWFSRHNAHMYYIKLRSLDARCHFIESMKSRNIQVPFHYIPLHSSPAGLKFCYFSGQDIHTTRESEKIARLPLWYNMTDDQVQYILEQTHETLGVLDNII